MADIGMDTTGDSVTSNSPIDDLTGSNLIRRRPNRVVKRFPLELQKAIRDVQFIQNHMKREDEYDEVTNYHLLFHFFIVRVCDDCYDRRRKGTKEMGEWERERESLLRVLESERDLLDDISNGSVCCAMVLYWRK